MGIKKRSDTEWDLIHDCGGRNDYEEIEFVPEGRELLSPLYTTSQVNLTENKE